MYPELQLINNQKIVCAECYSHSYLSIEVTVRKEKFSRIVLFRGFVCKNCILHNAVKPIALSPFQRDHYNLTVKGYLIQISIEQFEELKKLKLGEN